LNGKRTHSPRRQPWLAGVLILAVGSAGCGSSATPADQAEGGKALQTALDAWKGGKTPDELAKQEPSIHVADSDWKSGLVLKDYKTDGEGKLIGADLNYSVVLELRDAKGKAKTKKAVYAVSTHPQILVLRQDD
jgi:hypothetical protein